MDYPNKIPELTDLFKSLSEDASGLSKDFGQDVFNVAKVVLEYPGFVTWSGASRPNLHHYGNGGLQYHTWEVVSLCEQMGLRFRHQNISILTLLLAALFHDIGKVHDYKLNEKAEWDAAEHKYSIHHISKSAIIWSHAVTGTSLAPIHDAVLHAILAHHGQKQWGSPVEPRTREAWLLHLCDATSARMDDADRLILPYKKVEVDFKVVDNLL